MKTFDRGRSQQAYKSARGTLLTLVILTVANVIFWFARIDLEMLFCIDFPYIMAVIYDTTGIAIGAAVLLFFLAAWYLSAKNHVWLIAATVAHVLDTATLLWLASNSDVGDFVFPIIIHIVASVYLIIGCVNGAKLKKNAGTDPAFSAQPGAWQPAQTGQYQPYGQRDVYQQPVQPRQGQFYQPQQPVRPQYPPQDGQDQQGR